MNVEKLNSKCHQQVVNEVKRLLQDIIASNVALRSHFSARQRMQLVEHKFNCVKQLEFDDLVFL